MRVIDTNDAGLRTLIHGFPEVLAKFTSANCATCDLLAPSFEKYAFEPRHTHITFLGLGSDENPVARHMMNPRVAPILAAYHRGWLLEGDTLQTEQVVVALLQRLRVHSMAKAE